MKNPTVVPASTVLRMATIEGAKTLGMENEIGSLKEGKKADIVILKIEGTGPLNPENVVEQLVLRGTGSDVTDVFVDGGHVVKNGNLESVDEKEAYNSMKCEAERLWKQ